MYRVKISTPDQARRFGDHLAESLDKPVLVTVADFKRPKTHSQNALLHSLIDQLADFVGYTPGELKSYLKETAGPHKVVSIAGEERWVPKSVAEYSKEEISQLIEQTYRIAAEAGCVLEDRH